MCVKDHPHHPIQAGHHGERQRACPLCQHLPDGETHTHTLKCHTHSHSSLRTVFPQYSDVIRAVTQVSVRLAHEVASTNTSTQVTIPIEEVLLSVVMTLDAVFSSIHYLTSSLLFTPPRPAWHRAHRRA